MKKSTKIGILLLRSGILYIKDISLLNKNNKGSHMCRKLYDFSEADIEEYLKKFNKCLDNGRYTISRNRNKNDRYMLRYDINNSKALDILKSINVKDFCFAMENEHEDYKDEILYQFCKEVELVVRGELVNLDIFIKINLIENKGFVIVVSFHNYDRDKDGNIPYLFRQK